MLEEFEVEDEEERRLVSCKCVMEYAMGKILRIRI